MPHPSLKYLAATLLSLSASGWSDPVQYVQWGNQVMASGKHDDAIRYYSAALKEDARSVGAYKGLGKAMTAKGENAKAQQYLQYAAKLDPADAEIQQLIAGLGSAAPADPAETHYRNGVRYMQSKQHAYAAYYFDQAVQANPNSAKAWQGLGNAYHAQNSGDKAVQAWEKAVALDPSNTQLAQYVAGLKGQQPTASAEAAPSASAPTPASGDHPGFNPWIMGGTVAALGALMLFLF